MKSKKISKKAQKVKKVRVQPKSSVPTDEMLVLAAVGDGANTVEDVAKALPKTMRKQAAALTARLREQDQLRKLGDGGLRLTVRGAGRLRYRSVWVRDIKRT